MERKNNVVEKDIYNKIESDVKSDKFIKLFKNSIILLFVSLLSIRTIFIPENGLYLIMNRIMNNYLSFIISIIPVILIILITINVLNRKNSKINDNEKFIENFNYIQNN